MHHQSNNKLGFVSLNTVFPSNLPQGIFILMQMNLVMNNLNLFRALISNSEFVTKKGLKQG